MLSVGGFQERSCEGISRRAFLRAGASVPLALGLPGLSETQLLASTAKAKSVLLVWLGGGPSHLDLFDPKPMAPVEYRGPFSTIATRTPGAPFTELLPKLAARSDRFSVIRTNINHHGGHREAGSIGLTGIDRAVGDDEYPPNFGSILTRHRPTGRLPSFAIATIAVRTWDHAPPGSTVTTTASVSSREASCTYRYVWGPSGALTSGGAKPDG